MRRLVLSRLLTLIPLLVLVSFLVFAMMHVAPGSVSESILGEGATPERVAELDHELGLDRPFLTQYFDWLTSALRGDFGDSLLSRRPIGESLAQTVPVTLWLATGGLFVATVLGLGMGTLAAARPGGLVDRTITLISSVMLAVPGFWVGMLLAFYIGVRLGWLPAVGYVAPGVDPVGWIRSLVLPSIALGLGAAGSIARQMRGSLVDVLRRDYIRTAMAKGASPRRILLNHAFRNAMVPVSTVIGFQAATMLGGSLVVERVFGMPGLSTMAVPAVIAHDIPVILAVVMVTAAAVVLVNLVIDLLYGYFDPRVRVS